MDYYMILRTARSEQIVACTNEQLDDLFSKEKIAELANLLWDLQEDENQ